jgi:nitroreductase
VREPLEEEMDPLEALRTIGTARYFKPDPVSDELLYAAAEAARFAPQGGNRQPVRLLIVRDRSKCERLGELYAEEWAPMFEAADLATRELDPEDPVRRRVLAADDFARGFASHPATIVVCARLADLTITDTDLGRPSIVGGASVYPTVQNLCIALRVQGVASALTTILCGREPEVIELLGIPAGFATACCVSIGYPRDGFPRRLSRRPVEETTFVDGFDRPLSPPGGPRPTP